MKAKRWLTVVAVCFITLVTFLLVGSMIGSQKIRNLRETIEKPRGILAYEQLNALHQASTSETETPPGGIVETDAIQEQWDTDPNTLEDRYQEFERIMTEFRERSLKAYEANTKTSFSWKSNYQEWTEEEWQSFLDYFEGQKGLLSAMQALVAKKGPVKALAIEEGIFMNLDHLHDIRLITRWLCNGAVAQGHQGNYDAAYAYLRSAFQTAALLQDDPLLISYLIQAGCTRMAITNVWEAFPPGALSLEQSNALIALARKHNLKPRGVTALKSDSYLWLPLFESPKSWSAEQQTYALFGTQQTEGLDRKVQDLMASLYRTPFSTPLRQRNYTTALEISQDAYALTVKPRYAVQTEYEALRARIASLSGTQQVVRNLVSIYGEEKNYAGIADIQARIEAQFDLLWLGLRLEQFHTETGQYPIFLHNVIPNAPVDPFSGEDYRYELTEKAFLLYSIGPASSDIPGQRSPGFYDLIWRNATVPE